MPLVSETIIKHGVSHQQADNQAGKPGLKLIPCFTDTSQRAAVGPWRGSSPALHLPGESPFRKHYPFMFFSDRRCKVLHSFPPSVRKPVKQ